MESALESEVKGTRDRSAADARSSRHLTAPRRLAFWLLGASLLVTTLGNTLPTPLYVVYQERFGFSTLMITVIFAVYAAGVLLALVLFGASDLLGRRHVLLAGLACGALSAVAFLLANGLALLLVGRVLSGLSVGIFVGTATAALVETPNGRDPLQRHRRRDPRHRARQAYCRAR